MGGAGLEGVTEKVTHTRDLDKSRMGPWKYLAEENSSIREKPSEGPEKRALGMFGDQQGGPWLVRSEVGRGWEEVRSWSGQSSDHETCTCLGDRLSWNGRGRGSRRVGRMDGFGMDLELSGCQAGLTDECGRTMKEEEAIIVPRH